MNLTEDDIRNMSRAINLNIPESDLNTIRLARDDCFRFSSAGHDGLLRSRLR